MLIFQGVWGMVLYYCYVMVVVVVMIWLEVSLVVVGWVDSAPLRALYPEIMRTSNTCSVTIHLHINYIDIMT